MNSNMTYLFDDNAAETVGDKNKRSSLLRLRRSFLYHRIEKTGSGILNVGHAL